SSDVCSSDLIKKLNHDECFKDTLCERTAHDGFHFFFAKPKDMKISQNIGILPSVDLKAHENNYVVVAPSSLGEKKYQWLNSKPIRPAPAGLLELIKSKQKEIPPTKVAEIMLGMRKRTKPTGLFKTMVKGCSDKGKGNDNLESSRGGLLMRN